jgi:hypothetical protein
MVKARNAAWLAAQTQPFGPGRFARSALLPLAHVR